MCDWTWTACLFSYVQIKKLVKSGLAEQISSIANKDFMSSNCILHHEALASKKLSVELNETLQNVVNNIRASPLHSRIFAKKNSEMESEHKTLLLHAEVQWIE